MDQRDLSRTYFREVKELYDFVAEQVKAGLFKSEIIDKLIELGVDRLLAFDVLDEMERRLRMMRKRMVLLVVSETPAHEDIRKEFWISGYKVTMWEDLVALDRRLVEEVPDLVVVDAFDSGVKGREVLDILRRHIVGKKIPVFVLSDPRLAQKDFARWKKVRVFQQPDAAQRMLDDARELFLKRFDDGDDE